MSPKNGQAQAGLPFPLAAGDRAEYSSTATSGELAALAGTVRIEHTHEDESGATLFRVTCLNGGARHGQEFDAYGSELTK